MCPNTVSYTHLDVYKRQILGGTCSVVGTSTNVVVLGQVQKLGYEGIQMFTVTPMGLLYAAAGLLLSLIHI